MSNRKNNGSFTGKGYYIALVLCAAAIGISGYLYYRNLDETDPQIQTPTNAVDVLDPTEDDVQVVATQPTDPTSAPTDPTRPPQKKPFTTCRPVEGQTITVYAMDCLVYNETTRDWRVHNGIDIAADAGTKVAAAADGTVYTVYADDSMGMTVVIRHDEGYVTTYASLAQELSVKVGDTVKAGQTIGTVANTALLESAIGDHLHFSVTCHDVPMDPEEFFALG